MDTCINCYQGLELDEGSFMWYHAANGSHYCDGDEQRARSWGELVYETAEPKPGPFGVRWDGSSDVEVEPETDPWLQYPNGAVVLLADHLHRFPEGGCETCRAGFFAPTGNGPTDQGIERCDDCKVYDGDLEAARALAALIGPDIEVWYLPATTTGTVTEP